jgi:hypothetical protein
MMLGHLRKFCIFCIILGVFFNLAFVEDDVVCDDVICGSFVFKVKYCSDRMYVVCTNFRAHTAIPMNTGRLDGMSCLQLVALVHKKIKAVRS